MQEEDTFQKNKGADQVETTRGRTRTQVSWLLGKSSWYHTFLLRKRPPDPGWSGEADKGAEIIAARGGSPISSGGLYLPLLWCLLSCSLISSLSPSPRSLPFCLWALTCLFSFKETTGPPAAESLDFSTSFYYQIPQQSHWHSPFPWLPLNSLQSVSYLLPFPFPTLEEVPLTVSLISSMVNPSQWSTKAILLSSELSSHFLFLRMCCSHEVPGTTCCWNFFFLSGSSFSASSSSSSNSIFPLKVNVSQDLLLLPLFILYTQPAQSHS